MIRMCAQLLAKKAEALCHADAVYNCNTSQSTVCAGVYIDEAPRRL